MNISKVKTAYIVQHGPYDSIRFGELAIPALKENDVLIRMSAVTVNHVDTFIRSGRFQTDIPLPFIVGRDIVGLVENAGKEVKKFKPGQYVWSNCLGIEGFQGTFAEYIVAPENRLFLLPSNADPVESVAVVHSALTAIIGLFDKAGLKAGDNVFISGGSGSVGISVLQIAKASGAKVAVTAGDEEKAEFCLKMGADRVVNYHKENIAEAMHEFAPHGVDIFWESTRELDLPQVLPAMANHGRIVVIAGQKPSYNFPLWQFYTRNLTLYGFIVTGTSLERLQSYSKQINAWLSKGVLKAKIQKVMHLSETAEAHRMQEQEKLFGKLVLVP